MNRLDRYLKEKKDKDPDIQALREARDTLQKYFTRHAKSIYWADRVEDQLAAGNAGRTLADIRAGIEALDRAIAEASTDRHTEKDVK